MDVLNDGISDVSLVDVMGDDSSVVRAARVSYQGDERTGVDVEGDKKLINYLALHNHGTPFEHTSLTFHIACPLFVRGQWHRHRIGWSYNEVSRRYTAEDIKFHYPQEWRRQGIRNKQGSEGVVQAPYVPDEYEYVLHVTSTAYNLLITAGVAREQARMVLPQSTYTRFYATCNLRSLAHFVKLRSDPHAQAEIRAYSDAMAELAKEHFPLSMGATLPYPVEKYLNVVQYVFTTGLWLWLLWKIIRGGKDD